MLSLAVSEEEVSGIGSENTVGTLTCMGYFQSLKNPANEKFVKAFKAKYGQNRVVGDTLECGYISVYLWKLAAEKGPGFAHYVATKGAVVALTRALARELGEHGIRVNTISPDYIPHDPGYAGRQPEMAGFIAAQRCLKRDQLPEDMVGTLLHLVGPGSAFVTGQDLWVNGGRLFH